MEDQKFSLHGTIQKFKEYLENTKNITILKIVEKISSVIATVITDGLMLVFAVFILLFASIGLGFYFGDLFDSDALGFLALAGVYLLLIIILLISKGGVEKGLMNLSIRKLLKKWNETDGDK
ncbi:hypothetical protein [Albibacterium profundi]|uniref:Holin-X, holin superfamily III n=1 Tax=Albibacterium profundi TaxID=3134906 RepID=A0ABV5CGV8_9SPHI